MEQKPKRGRVTSVLPRSPETRGRDSTCTTEMYGCISLHSVLFLQLLAQIE